MRRWIKSKLDTINRKNSEFKSLYKVRVKIPQIVDKHLSRHLLKDDYMHRSELNLVVTSVTIKIMWM